MRVRAIKKGYYGQLREEGDEFEISDKKDLGSWMQSLDGRGRKPKETESSSSDETSALE